MNVALMNERTHQPVATRVEIHHEVSASFGGPATPRHVYYGLRNGLLYAEQHLSRLNYLRLLEHSSRSALRPLLALGGAACIACGAA